jgi:hypothetical protein
MSHEKQSAAESSNVTNGTNKPSRTSSDVIAVWLKRYATVYREELNEELILAYVESLKELPPELLHQAFLRAMKRSKFRPTPAEVRESFNAVMERQPRNRPKYPIEPKLTREEREAVLNDPVYQEFRKQFLKVPNRCTVSKAAQIKEDEVPLTNREYSLSYLEGALQSRCK